MKFKTLTDLIIIVVAITWLTSVLAGIWDHSYKIPETVQATMAAAVAFLFGSRYMQQGKP